MKTRESIPLATLVHFGPQVYLQALVKRVWSNERMMAIVMNGKDNIYDGENVNHGNGTVNNITDHNTALSRIKDGHCLACDKNVYIST